MEPADFSYLSRELGKMLEMASESCKAGSGPQDVILAIIPSAQDFKAASCLVQRAVMKELLELAQKYSGAAVFISTDGVLSLNVTVGASALTEAEVEMVAAAEVSLREFYEAEKIYHSSQVEERHWVVTNFSELNSVPLLAELNRRITDLGGSDIQKLYKGDLPISTVTIIQR